MVGAGFVFGLDHGVRVVGAARRGRRSGDRRARRCATSHRAAPSARRRARARSPRRPSAVAVVPGDGRVPDADADQGARALARGGRTRDHGGDGDVGTRRALAVEPRGRPLAGLARAASAQRCSSSGRRRSRARCGCRCRSSSPTSGGASSGVGMGIAFATIPLAAMRVSEPGEEGEELSAVLLMDMLGVAIGAGLGGAAIALSDALDAPLRTGSAVPSRSRSSPPSCCWPSPPASRRVPQGRSRRPLHEHASAIGRRATPRGRARGALARVPRDGDDRRTGGLRLGLGGRSPALPRRRAARARALGSMDDPRRDRGDDGARRTRAARRVRGVPRARDAREAGRDRRRDLRRPARARARRRLERGRVPGVRVPVRSAGLAVRGVVRGDPSARRRRTGHDARRARSGATTRCCCPRRHGDPD